jgi:YidC/Oxa1 family membrane protein insertase
MSQTRTFLIIAWLMVASLLWMEWNKEQSHERMRDDTATALAQSAAAEAASTAGLPVPGVPQPGAPTTQGASPEAAAAESMVPQAVIPAAAGSASNTAAAQAMSAAPAATTVILSNDLLRLTLDGGNVRQADLLKFPQERKTGSPPVRLLQDSGKDYYIAQSGWVSAKGAPNHNGGFVPAQAQREFAMAQGQNSVSASFVWTGADGVVIRRTYTLKRGDYALTVRDDIANRSAAPWKGYVYRQLSRIPPAIATSIMQPTSFAFNGAAWYSPEEKYEKRKYEKYQDDGPLNVTVGKGWVALLQHYFFTAWIPQEDQKANFSLVSAGNQYGIVATGPEFTLAPGQTGSTTARLWIGPKIQESLQKIAPGLSLTLDYGIFTVLAQPIHWTLATLHKFTSNWGWAIVLLVVLIKLLLYPLSAAQYKSMAKMRKFQPRMQQLKERYGDDKEKYQLAMVELYKKEKINPAGGCLPIFIQMPVFLSLYWVLVEAVELRQAPWMLWVQDLTASDPFFILPILNIAIMWLTQRMTPMIGMEPTQQKIMQAMPLIIGVTLMFFPAGLVLYWVTNGALGMLQQWWMMKKYGDKPDGKAVVAK